ncbi:MAG TPA: putative quinol monooxygenase [Rhabdaerophilum sp.]|nr:putative quinol monooxygenase [Rhabdaerophilum sp.]
MAEPVIVMANVKVRPDARETWRKAAMACIAETRKEAGCLAYDMFESVSEVGTFVFVEQWHDRAALDLHMTRPHLQALVAVAGTCVTAPPSIEAIDGGTRWRLM